MSYAPTVVFDFDGVIHSYRSGWKGPGVIPDPVVPGIVEAIDELRAKGYRVVVVSTRCADPEGKVSVENYLTENHIAVDGVMAEKPPALCYVDDRAICFKGNAGKLVDQIKKFRSWVEDPQVQIEDCDAIRIQVLTAEKHQKLTRGLPEQGAGQVIEFVPNPVEQLRPCRGVYWNRGAAIEVAGRFHGWGSNCLEFDAGPGNYTTALIEREDGQVFECDPGTIRFLDRENGERR